MRRDRWVLSVLMVLVPAIMIVNIGNSCSPVESNLGIFAAAGAKPAIDEICQKFEKEFGARVEISYGGGGEVLSQMVLSKSGDVYIAPEQRFMETAKEKQVVYPETINSIAYMIPV